MSAPVGQERVRRLAELRGRLQSQRLRIIGQLGGSAAGDGEVFPRSATLRMIGRRPELVASTLGLFFSLFRSR